MNSVQIFKNQEMNVNVRTICNDDGSISINAEDAAIGFGWFQVKNGKCYVRWERMNDFSAECGFPHVWGKEDFIPESLFYMLGMKANSETALKFQKWLAIDVIPSIRKTGSYTIEKATYPPKASSIGEIVQLGRFIKQLMKEQEATPYQIAEVVVDTMKQFGITLNDKILLPARLEKVKEDELDMVEFACTFPNSSYQDYLLYRTMIKISR